MVPTNNITLINRGIKIKREGVHLPPSLFIQLYFNSSFINHHAFKLIFIQ
jgi:hypothetical protein